MGFPNQHHFSHEAAVATADHCNVDRLWGEWERINGNVYEPESKYNRCFNVDDEFYAFLQYVDTSVITARS